jgi:mRNA interferase MazF
MERAVPTPKFGEIWDADLDPVKVHEQGGFRPVLIISSNEFNSVPHGLCIAVPITRTERGVRSHIRVAAGDGGLATPSVILCEQVRSLSVTRLRQRRGMVSEAIRDLAAGRVAGYLVQRDA